MDSYKIIEFPGSQVPSQYRNMLFAKFLRSLRDGNKYFKRIDAEMFFKNYNIYFDHLLMRPESVVKIAVLTDDTDVVVGWCLAEANKLHYVWVPLDGRRQGIATALVSEGFEWHSHETDLSIIIKDRKFPNVKFNPFL